MCFLLGQYPLHDCSMIVLRAFGVTFVDECLVLLYLLRTLGRIEIHRHNHQPCEPFCHVGAWLCYDVVYAFVLNLSLGYGMKRFVVVAAD